MKVSTVFPGSRSCREVKKLYESAFPAEERYPFLRMLLLKSLNPNVELLAYERDGNFCGFTMTVCTVKYLYINFIAVNPALRSRGVGAEILRYLAGAYPDKAMLVEVLSPPEGSCGWEQRNRRLEFYRRNGFFDLSRTVSGKGGDYVLLSTDAVYDREAYWRIFDHMSFKFIFRFRKLKRS